MADDVRVTNWPNADEGVAMATIRLWEYLRTQDGGPTTIEDHLALVRRCRAAISGRVDPTAKSEDRRSTGQGGGFY